MPAKLVDSWYRGDTWRRVYRWGTRAADGTVSYVNLTGYTARYQLRASDDTLLLESAPGEISLHVSPSGSTENGWVIVTIPATRTASLAVGRVVFDLELTAPDGTVTTIVRVTGVVEADVTR